MSDRAKKTIVRAFMIVPTLLIMLTVVFFLIRLTGDPVHTILGQYSSKEAIAAVRLELGLDRPLLVQYGTYVWNLMHGNMGKSLVDGSSVAHNIMVAMPYTLLLALSAFVVATVIGVPLGIIAAVRRNTWVDMGAVLFSMSGRVIPSFVLGILLMIVLSVKLDWLPVMGVGEGPKDILIHLIMPALALGLNEAGLICRMTRSAVLEVLGSEYVRTARAKGLSESIVLWRHVLRNAMITLLTVLGLRLARLVGGSAIMETLFVRIGMGSLMVEAIYTRDFPVVQGTIVVFAAWVLVVNLVVDLLYGVLDPRMKGV